MRSMLFSLAVASAVPIAATAAPLAFQDGMELTVVQGVPTAFSFILDACAGGDGCHTTAYYGGPGVWDYGVMWLDNGINGSGTGGLCGGSSYCYDMYFEPVTLGRFDLAFELAYETYYLLGGDDYGAEFPVIGENYIGHSFVLNVVPAAAVPVPAAGGLLAAAFAGLGIAVRKRRHAA